MTRGRICGAQGFCIVYYSRSLLRAIRKRSRVVSRGETTRRNVSTSRRAETFVGKANCINSSKVYKTSFRFMRAQFDSSRVNKKEIGTHEECRVRSVEGVFRIWRRCARLPLVSELPDGFTAYANSATKRAAHVAELVQP